jgi:hypothetical protein
MGAKIALALMASALVGAAPTAEVADPRTINSEMPPERFRAMRKVSIEFADNLNEKCGNPPPKKAWGGCRRGNTLYMPNPCFTYSQDKSQHYAKITCHELAHMNGWTKYHED